MNKLTLMRRFVAILTLLLCFLSAVYINNTFLLFMLQLGLGISCILNGIFISRTSDKNKIDSRVTFAVGIFIILIAIINFMKY